MTQTYATPIAAGLGVRPTQAAAVIELLDAGNTLPFIARYRKEATGGLDEEQIRQISAEVDRLRALDERRQAILKSIEEQGKLTPQLQSELLKAESLTALEDLYQPYKPKRRTRASIAREKDLQKLTEWILQQPRPRPGIQPAAWLAEIVRPFINAAVPDAEAAWAGARDIVAETISDNAEVRRQTREKALKWAVLQAEKAPDAADERRVYETYYQFEAPASRLRPHQTLALNRGESEKVLRLHLQISERDWLGAVHSVYAPNPASPLAPQMQQAIQDSAERLLLPAIERDVRRALSETAQRHAIQTFAANLRALLLQPPIAGRVVIGLDPGFRTGCKVAVVDATGKLLETATIYPHEPQRDWERALKILQALAIKHNAGLVSIGNGTASRETELLSAELLRRLPPESGLQYLITNEAGASVYSASPLARAELPDLDVSLRGAVSIARRVQDPLAELVKIDPQSIGVGLYQHDVEQKELTQALAGVVESVVNAVGVDVNTASPALLAHVAGIGPKLAEKIVAQRQENGPFTSRQALRKVPGLGPKAFEQAAGFLRIRAGENPLDASAIHPESYPVAEALLRQASLRGGESLEERRAALERLQRQHSPDGLAAALNCGLPTLKDILEQLVRPGRDPRSDTPPPILRSDVLKMEDLAPGMSLKGTVRNMVDFGAFIDIGVKQDGLLHRSQMPAGAHFQVGDIVQVQILKIEPERGRISLGMPPPSPAGRGPG